ncbi:hypothetical protein ACHAPQ_000229 [Fusarium lateritium]
MAIPVALLQPALEAIGFTPIGPAAESFAACAQSMIGNVVPESCFAILQSAGMGGYGVDILRNAGQLAAGSAFSLLRNVMEAGNSTCPI